jgi:multicomponent Na+:H+ antiporter subunit E
MSCLLASVVHYRLQRTANTLRNLRTSLACLASWPWVRQLRMNDRRTGRHAGTGAIFCWAFLVWVLLTWTLTAEQLLFGALVAAVVAVAVAPLGGTVGPWLLLHPGRLAGAAWLLAVTASRVVMSNVRLARRIWDPRRPLTSGMVIAATRERRPGGLTAVGVMTSVVVDNQLVDLDPSRGQLQYHAVVVPAGGPDEVAEAINLPSERLLRPLWRDRGGQS